MANDIQAAISGNVVKNGTAVTTCNWTGEFSVLNTAVINIPTINDIQSKFDNRFDDIVYYSLAVTGTPPSGCC